MPTREKRVGIFTFVSVLMDINAHYKIGYILKPHGLKGEVTVSVDAEAPEEFGALESLFVLQNSQLVPHFIESISLNGEKAYIKFEDVDTLAAASTISKCALYLPKSTRSKSGRGEFYDDEIIGFEVVDDEAGLLGKIVGITVAGPNKLLTVDHNGKEILIPLNGPFVKSINKSKKKITVELPEGFLDI
jgi:16S rRNA processing protein RimM